MTTTYWEMKFEDKKKATSKANFIKLKKKKDDEW